MNDIDAIYTAIGAHIRKEREALGFLQNDLASFIGIQRTSITNIEAGRQRLPIHMLYQIAEAMAIPVIDLIPTENELHP